MTPDQARASVVRLLSERLVATEAKRGVYSIRSFAKYLGIASQVLSQILIGERVVTRKFATKVPPVLAADSDLTRAILSALPEKQIRRKGGPASSSFPVSRLQELGSTEFRLISDWWYFAILSLYETEGFSGDWSL